ncbi:MAG: FKBP-type peptidyl-prolyl cis-trans isomerase [Henriciella sp.]|uniref:FKBP-type peptidyl-prolyl cis-trans isomerase n=1 Tax=Henriciella sp. TaxID=1968823 RepID=UPI003C75FA37
MAVHIRRLKLAAIGMAGMLVSACQSLPNLPGINASGKRQASSGASACPNVAPGPGSFTPPFPSTCEGVQASASGLEWLAIRNGPEGKAAPGDGATVIVAYEGYLASDGSRFDSSYARGEPAVFNLDAVIEGWTETLKRMTPGDEWLVYIPAELAYGAGSPGPGIPPNSDLIFKIRLDGFLDADEIAEATSTARQSGASEALWADFLPWDKTRKGVVRLKSGLSYYVIDAGEPRSGKILADDIVMIDYEARLADTGETVGATWTNGEPLTVRAGDAVPGFAQMISLMPPGAIWIGHIPSPIAYGQDGLGEAIPPGADLVYLVNLIAVTPD